MDNGSKLTTLKLNKIIKENSLKTTSEIIQFLLKNKTNYSFFDLSKIAEHANQMRIENSAYYTDEELLSLIEEDLPDFSETDEISILEPSVGVGNFLPILFNKYKNKKIRMDVVDIDEDSLKILRTLISIFDVPKNVKINYICSDFCTLALRKRYNLAVGNPPFTKVKKPYLSSFSKTDFYNYDSSNLASYFYEKCCKHSDFVCLVMPKNILNTPEFIKTRKFLGEHSVETIIDFGEKGFKGVLVETIYLKTNLCSEPSITNVYSLTKELRLKQKQNYIFDLKLPYWIIYRNSFFDSFLEDFEFDIFESIRDRQITDKVTNKCGKGIRVLKSRNISDNGQNIVDLKNYDEFIAEEKANKLAIYSYLEDENVYLTPNMTYNTRVMRKPKGVLTNGSIAILIPKNNIQLSQEQLVFFSSREYRDFMQIARNFQTRTLNIDATSVYFFGIRR